MPDPITTKTDDKGQEAPSSKPKTVWVVSTNAENRVWWERDTDHPDLDLVVDSKVPKEAALTAEVNARLRGGQLREATDTEIAKRKAQLGAAAVEAPKGPWD